MARFDSKERKVAEVMGVVSQHLTKDAKGRKKWAEGWDAARVAKQCGVSKAFVSEVHHFRMKPVTISAGPSPAGMAAAKEKAVLEPAPAAVVG